MIDTFELLKDKDSIAKYSVDRSDFAIEPEAVAIVRSSDDIVDALDYARESGLSITARAGGSSVAGQCLGSGLIVDTSQMDSIEIDSDKVHCGPGANLKCVNEELARSGRMIGPDVSSSHLACCGGLVSTNACGSRSLRYGRFRDIIERADVVSSDGQIQTLVRGNSPGNLEDGLEQLHEKAISLTDVWPDLHRSYGGYDLKAFVDHGDALSLIPGSEGTLALITGMTLSTVELPLQRSLVAIGFANVDESLKAAATCVKYGSCSVELLSGHILEGGRSNLQWLLREGYSEAALLVEFLDSDTSDIAQFCSEFGDRAKLLDDRQAQLVRELRRSALSAMAGLCPLALFEDPSVALEKLPEFVERLTKMLDGYGIEVMVYGHVAAGCLHIRPLIDHAQPNLAAHLQAVSWDVAELVKKFDGVLTGEHGWGLSRSYLVEQMLGSDIYGLFKDIKKLFDPDGLLNPGKIVDGVEPFSHLRV